MINGIYKIRMIEEKNAAEPRAALRRKLFIMHIMQILLIMFLISLAKKTNHRGADWIHV